MKQHKRNQFWTKLCFSFRDLLFWASAGIQNQTCPGCQLISWLCKGLLFWTTLVGPGQPCTWPIFWTLGWDLEFLMDFTKIFWDLDFRLGLDLLDNWPWDIFLDFRLGFGLLKNIITYMMKITYKVKFCKWNISFTLQCKIKII